MYKKLYKGYQQKYDVIVSKYQRCFWDTRCFDFYKW